MGQKRERRKTKSGSQEDAEKGDVMSTMTSNSSSESTAISATKEVTVELMNGDIDWSPMEDEIEYATDCAHLKHVHFSDVRKKLKPFKDFPKCTGCSADPTNTPKDGDPTKALVVCLSCGNVGCGRYVMGHAVAHYTNSHTGNHSLCYNLDQHQIWCYDCDAWIKPTSSGKLSDAVKQLEEFLKKWTAKQSKANGNVNSQINDVVSNYNGHVIDEPEHAKVHKSVSGIGGGRGNAVAPAKTISPVDTGLESHIKGLQNLGNTCFFNSVMECLCQTHPILYLIDKLSGEKSSMVLAPKNHEKYPRISVDLADISSSCPLLTAFASFVRHFQTQSNGKSSVLNPGTLFSQIVRKAPRFKGYQQQDSHELLRYLLDGLKFEESKRVQTAIRDKLEKQIKPLTDTEKLDIIRTYEQAGSSYLVERVFGGKLLQSIYCKRCKRYSNTFEPFLDLSLPIDDATNVEKKSHMNGSAPRADIESDDDEGIDGGGIRRSAAGGGSNCSKHMKKKQRRELRRRNRKKSTSNNSHTNELSAVSSRVNSMTLSDEDEVMEDADSEGEDEEVVVSEEEDCAQASGTDHLNSGAMLRRLRSHDTTNWKTDCHIGSCLTAFMQVDYLTGRNQFGCEACWKDEHKNNPSKYDEEQMKKKNKPRVIYTDAEKSYLIFEPPAVLTIHLKRFQQRGFMTQKWSKAVEFPPLLDLGPYTSSMAQVNATKLCPTKQNRHALTITKQFDRQNVDRASGKVLYSLFGVVTHSGSMRGGHYVSFVKVRNRHDDLCSRFIDIKDTNNISAGKTTNGIKTDINGNESSSSSSGLPSLPPGQWYYCSDSHVSSVPVSRVMQTEAYILFYERIM